MNKNLSTSVLVQLHISSSPPLLPTVPSNFHRLPTYLVRVLFNSHMAAAQPPPALLLVAASTSRTGHPLSSAAPPKRRSYPHQPIAPSPCLIGGIGRSGAVIQPHVEVSVIRSSGAGCPSSSSMTRRRAPPISDGGGKCTGACADIESCSDRHWLRWWLDALGF